jgi:phenylpropionate dioxygenase-like ring-hydroxylating dioxygenase large terminal subunit
MIDVTATELEGRLVALRRSRSKRADAGRNDWTAWPTYDASALGFRDWWYPVAWSNQIGESPTAITLCGTTLMVVRDGGSVYALHDRCPHRGVPLSEGTKEFPATVSCPYHGWTYRLSDGELVAVITDGPDSPICGKVSVQTYPVVERLGMVWVFIGDEEPHSIDDQLPEELTQGDRFTIGGRINERTGNWRYACENGYDEGHAKFLHRTSWWRIFKVMPTWNRTHIEQDGRWLYRVQDEVHWEADFPGVGHWTNIRPWKIKPPAMKTKAVSNIGNTGGAASVDPVIKRQGFPGFASVSLPGVLRIAYPQFIHYEFYVPIDADNHRYVGVMVQFKTGLAGWWYRTRYLSAIRWLFHGNFSNQDKWMVELTDCPPERLYRPDSSLIAWRRLCEVGARPNGGANRPIGVDVVAAAAPEPTIDEERTAVGQ